MKGLEPGRASVSLIRPWLLPGLTAREWEEKGWLHTAQSARKPPNGRANAGQVIWRLGCIKALYKGLKDLRCFTYSVCAFYTTWHWAAQVSFNQYGRAIKNVVSTGVWRFVWLRRKGGLFYGEGGSWRLVRRRAREIIRDALHARTHIIIRGVKGVTL